MSDVDVFDVGETARVSEVLTELGVSVDPVTVTFQIRTPAGATSSATAVKDSTGHYHGDILCAVEGIYWWRMSGSSDKPFADEDFIVVRRTSF